MVTVLRGSGFRVIIFLDDHLPGHVHVFGDGHAKINLAGPGGECELVWVEGMKRSEVRKALQLVEDHRADLLLRWRDIHG